MLPCVAAGRSARRRVADPARELSPSARPRLAAGATPLHVLDLGAGSGWLSHRLTALGHRVVAVDAIDDEVDGLGACRHYAGDFAAVQADFDALPFAPAQFDLVVFNGSLHYAADTGATLERAHRVLAPGGALVVMDSPMFRADGDGRRWSASSCGGSEPIRLSDGRPARRRAI